MAATTIGERAHPQSLRVGERALQEWERRMPESRRPDYPHDARGEEQAASPAFAPPSLVEEASSTARPSRIVLLLVANRFTEICRVHL